MECTKNFEKLFIFIPIWSGISGHIHSIDNENKIEIEV